MQLPKGKYSTVLLLDSEGFSDYTCYLARGLSKYCQVILYGFSQESFIVTGAAHSKGIKFHYIKKMLPKGSSALRGIIRVILLFFILFAVLVRTRYDIVHVQENLPTFFIFIPILKIRRKQICWTLHDVEIFSPATGIDGKLQVLFLKIVSQPYLMRKCVDKIFVHASSLREQLVAKRVNYNKIEVIRHFDYMYLLEFNNNKGNIKHIDSILNDDYVLFFGNIAPWKGINVLMDAARIVRKALGEKFNLVIAGKPYKGYNASFYSNFVEEDYDFLKIINRFITASEIPYLVEKSSFLVLPYNDSFQHSVSGIITLAYTFSKPVITSNVRSLTEYVDHDKTGYIFNINDAEQLAKFIIELIVNNNKCVEMGNRGHHEVLDEMSVENCCKTIHNIYNTLE